jgi:hypothetical protein
MKLKTITVLHVEFMPKQLEPGILYVSEKYGAAAHLCACGCGEKIRTPLGSTEWAVSGAASRPSLWPSVGNWQKPCRSHYIIGNGKIVWCGNWTPEQIAAGRYSEEIRRRAYYDQMYAQQRVWQRFWRWILLSLGIGK